MCLCSIQSGFKSGFLPLCYCKQSIYLNLYCREKNKQDVEMIYKLLTYRDE